MPSRWNGSDRGAARREFRSFGAELADSREMFDEAALIILFTYFYTAVQFNPVDQADNLRKYGGYIPGIRPGPPTAQYLDRVLTRTLVANFDESINQVLNAMILSSEIGPEIGRAHV